MSYGEKIKWFKVDLDNIEKLIKSGDGTGTVTENTIRKDAFIIYNKVLASETSATAAVVFSDLLTSYSSILFVLLHVGLYHIKFLSCYIQSS